MEHKILPERTESIVADGGLSGTARDLFLAPFNWPVCSRNLRTVTVKAVIMEHWVAGHTNNYSYRRRDEREFCLGCYGGLSGTARDLFLAPFNWPVFSRNLRTVTVKAVIMEHWVAGHTNNYSYRRRDEREFCLGRRN
ncbi:hypothetical protein CDAR_109081 [Caerostris darwini]|uniref:Uncharacterized protein n=1 Tax=Caerostris darwini TaxID=1538125 RepID=A0AAV4VDL9_9ARAC|nr:hypothetical protein CDAR_109081 [Caerostris darwini]